jgi:hypothetical protein
MPNDKNRLRRAVQPDDPLIFCRIERIRRKGPGLSINSGSPGEKVIKIKPSNARRLKVLAIDFIS